MSERFKAPSAEELVARGLNPDGTPKQSTPKVKVKLKTKVKAKE